MKLKPPIIGATYYCARGDYGRGPNQFCDVKVTKIGRKWATFEQVGYEGRAHMGGRFNISNGRLDGGDFSSPGRVFNDEAHFHNRQREKKLWEEFKDRLRHQFSVPDGVGEIEILKAADALGFRLKGE